MEGDEFLVKYVLAPRASAVADIPRIMQHMVGTKWVVNLSAHVGTLPLITQAITTNRVVKATTILCLK